MMSEDISFCLNWNCKYMKCFRNQKHIKLPIPHSFMDFADKPGCPKWEKNQRRIQNDRMASCQSDSDVHRAGCGN